MHLQLAKEEATEAAKGVLPKHKVTLTAFLIAAFEIEEEQYVLHSFQQIDTFLIDTPLF